MTKAIGRRWRARSSVVGDPDQAIYSVAGANMKNILRFEKDYRRCLGWCVLDQKLPAAQKTILEQQNSLIRHNKDRYEKTIVEYPGHWV